MRIDAGDIKGGLGGSGSKNGHTHAKWYWGAGYDRESSGRTNRILCQALFKIVEWNRVVINSVSGAKNHPMMRDERHRRHPGNGDARAKVFLWCVVKMAAGQLADWHQPKSGIERRKSPARLVHRAHKII